MESCPRRLGLAEVVAAKSWLQRAVLFHRKQAMGLPVLWDCHAPDHRSRESKRLMAKQTSGKTLYGGSRAPFSMLIKPFSKYRLSQTSDCLGSIPGLGRVGPLLGTKVALQSDCWNHVLWSTFVANWLSTSNWLLMPEATSCNLDTGKFRVSS